MPKGQWMREHTNADERWIPEDQYQFICSLVPILCVDLLPLIASSDNFGLIERDDYKGRRGLNLVGGGVLIDESLEDAVHRHLAATLGNDVWLEPGSLSLVGVYQYARTTDVELPHDPRKNAVSITYTGIMHGNPQPAGEAHSFHIFEIGSPPGLDTFGFGQGHVVYDGLKTVATHLQR